MGEKSKSPLFTAVATALAVFGLAAVCLFASDTTSAAASWTRRVGFVAQVVGFLLIASDIYARRQKHNLVPLAERFRLALADIHMVDPPRFAWAAEAMAEVTEQALGLVGTKVPPKGADLEKRVSALEHNLTSITSKLRGTQDELTVHLNDAKTNLRELERAYEALQRELSRAAIEGIDRDLAGWALVVVSAILTNVNGELASMASTMLGRVP